MFFTLHLKHLNYDFLQTDHDFNLEKQNLVHSGKLKVQEEYAQKEKDLEIEQRVLDFLCDFTQLVLSCRNLIVLVLHLLELQELRK